MKGSQNFPAQTAAIAIICKTPAPGASKTRLISVLGPERAAELAGCFLRDIAVTIAELAPAAACRGYAVYAPEGSEETLRSFLPSDFGLLCRRDATLGVVLDGASAHLLASGHDCVVLVNADSPTLPASLLQEAISLLRQPGHRVVLSPAIDGGYYLIGLKHPCKTLFTDIPWSTPVVYQTTLTRAAEAGLSVASLAPWYDVDEVPTLALLLAELSRKGVGFDPGGLVGNEPASTRAFFDRHSDVAREIEVRYSPVGLP